MAFDELRKSLDLFGIADHATFAVIRRRYRELVKTFHPDTGEAADEEKIRLVTEAYRVIHSYCSSYTFRFSREEYLEQNPDERLRQQFGGDPWDMSR